MLGKREGDDGLGEQIEAKWAWKALLISTSPHGGELVVVADDGRNVVVRDVVRGGQMGVLWLCPQQCVLRAVFSRIGLERVHAGRGELGHGWK